MSGLTIDINSADLQRIRGKLAKIQNNIMDRDSFVLKYMIKLTNEYCETVASGMGTVDPGESAIGGEYITETLNSPFLGDKVTVRWLELSPRTVRMKEALHYDLRTTIWMASGQTRGAVRPQVKVFKHTASLFGGIDKSLNPEAYKRALAVETGAGEESTWEARALFARVNEIFVQHHAEIVAGIQAALRDTIKQSGW